MTEHMPWEEESRRLECYRMGAVELAPGDRVRLRPRGKADIMDVVLAGKIATIAAIEEDYENRVHFAVTVDEDPGKDIGKAGKIAHRFFFGPDEIEPLTNPDEVYEGGTD